MNIKGVLKGGKALARIGTKVFGKVAKKTEKAITAPKRYKNIQKRTWTEYQKARGDAYKAYQAHLAQLQTHKEYSDKLVNEMKTLYEKALSLYDSKNPEALSKAIRNYNKAILYKASGHYPSSPYPSKLMSAERNTALRHSKVQNLGRKLDKNRSKVKKAVIGTTAAAAGAYGLKKWHDNIELNNNIRRKANNLRYESLVD